MKQEIHIVKDALGHKIVIIPNVIFKNKQNIDWNAVEKYLKKYVGKIATIVDTNDIVYIGAAFPNEYKGSKYTKRLKGAYAKAKANAAQGIVEMLKIATKKRFRENHKEKHFQNAGNGWYYYTTRFALPIYENDIKREASTPLTISELTPW